MFTLCIPFVPFRGFVPHSPIFSIGFSFCSHSPTVTIGSQMNTICMWICWKQRLSFLEIEVILNQKKNGILMWNPLKYVMNLCTLVFNVIDIHSIKNGGKDSPCMSPILQLIVDVNSFPINGHNERLENCKLLWPGDVPGNYRGISLVSHIGKLFTSTISCNIGLMQGNPCPHFVSHSPIFSFDFSFCSNSSTVTIGSTTNSQASLEFCVSPAKIMSFYIIINI
jgi:hypothetical protein